MSMKLMTSWVGVIALGLVWTTAVRATSPPCDQLLPGATKVFVSAPSFHQLWTRFENSQMGRLWNSPELKPFVSLLIDDPEMIWSRAERSTGTSFDELREIASGEACLAVVELAKGRSATVFLVRVAGNEAAARDLIARVQKRLSAAGAQASHKNIEGTTVQIFELPRKETRSIYFLKDDTLVLAGDLDLATMILSQRAGDLDGTLSRVAAYQDVMTRCRERAAGLSPDLQWYCEPAQIIHWMSRTDPEGEEEGGVEQEESSLVKGFDAIQGVGGWIHLDAADEDLRHWTSIFAPPPYEQSMRIMAFPPGGDFEPMSWIGNDVSSLLTFYIDVQNAFRHCGPLYDEFFAGGAEGTFGDLIEHYRSSSGPQVDVGPELVSQLENRIDFIGQYSRRVSASSEVSVIAIRTKNEQEVASVIDRLMGDDPGASEIEISGHGHGLWKLGDDTEKIPGETSEVICLGVTVADGFLLMARDYRAIQRLFTKDNGHGSLADDPAYQRLTRKLASIDQAGVVLKAISFWERDYLTSYELLRREATDELSSKSVQVILGLLEAAGDGDLSHVKFDQLAPFDKVRQYFGISGLIGRNHENGWLLEGIIEPPAH